MTCLAGIEGIHTVEQIKGKETKKNYFLTDGHILKSVQLTKDFFSHKMPSNKRLWF